MNFAKYVFSQPYQNWLLNGIVMMLLIAALTTIFSIILGFSISFLRMSKNKFSKWFSSVYITFFRNIPPVPLLLFLVFALPGLFKALTGINFPRDMEFTLLITGLSLNTSAYIAEIIRSGVRGVPSSMGDAGRVLGLSPSTINLKIIYPQALRIVFPALGTRLIHNMKNSSIAFVLPLAVGNMEITGQAGRIAGQTFAWAEPLIFSAIVYLAFSLIISVIVNFTGNKMQAKVMTSR
jgi:polar amino acid transport system permease protein